MRQRIKEKSFLKNVFLNTRLMRRKISYVLPYLE